MGSHGSEDLGLLCGGGEVLVLGRVVLQIVELLAIGPDGVTQAVSSNGFA